VFNRLYIHVPFCREKCRYCAFVSDKPEQDDLAEYPELLTREIRLLPAAEEPVASVYFGGGTPSLLYPADVARLLEEINAHMGIEADAEITLEVNPGTVSCASLHEFRHAGINRLSLGIQSFDDGFLECLGRIHSADQARQAFQDARTAGFANISIDLIHALPGQSLPAWRSELRQATALCPEHISVYGLTVETGTPFAKLYPADSPELADEDLAADMFELADDLLVAGGFDHYEIASYARPGYRSRHNSGYWQRDGYRGVGVAAHSFLREGHGVRFSNPDTLAEYRQGITAGRLVRVDEQQLTRRDAMAEYLFLGLRLADGVRPSAFEHEFGCSLESVYGPVVAGLEQLGLVVLNGDALFVTHRGMLLSNQVFSRFL
jgi:oxygen-independent coproporphyrinogen-3 oxidase